MYALLIRTYAAAVTERPLQDVLRAHTAVGGLVEEVRVVPAVFALSEEIFQLNFAFGTLEAAPQCDEHWDQNSNHGPEEQRPLLP